MKPNYETIYLVPTDYDGGQLTYNWCDCPAPGEGMDPEDAIKYVRADLVPDSNEVLAQRIVELTNERDAALAQLASKTDIANQLKDGLAESFEKRMALKAQVKQLREALNNQLNDCINFDGGKLTDSIMESSTEALKSTPSRCLATRDAEIKAQAVSEVWKHFNGKFRQNEKLTVMEVCIMLNNHIGYLRQQAKGE